MVQVGDQFTGSQMPKWKTRHEGGHVSVTLTESAVGFLVLWHGLVGRSFTLQLIFFTTAAAVPGTAVALRQSAMQPVANLGRGFGNWPKLILIWKYFMNGHILDYIYFPYLGMGVSIIGNKKPHSYINQPTCTGCWHLRRVGHWASNGITWREYLAWAWTRKPIRGKK